jgi:hypothetical protein
MINLLNKSNKNDNNQKSNLRELFTHHNLKLPNIIPTNNSLPGYNGINYNSNPSNINPLITNPSNTVTQNKNQKNSSIEMDKQIRDLDEKKKNGFNVVQNNLTKEESIRLFKVLSSIKKLGFTSPGWSYFYLEIR